MDLGIKGRKAIVCAGSKGLGKGCALALAREGVELTIIARGKEALEQTAAEIRAATGTAVQVISADITKPEGRQAALDACPAPDILINNAGGPPAGDFRDWNRDTWIAALDANMLTPIELIRLTVDGMISRGFGRIVNITSSAVKAPIDILGLSNGARTGLTGFVAGLSRKTIQHNVTINNLLPGLFATDTMFSRIEAMAKTNKISVDDAKNTRLKTIPAGRFGSPDEFGAMCAYICSAHASYITGQNFLIDGGAYPGTF
ncbi:MAG: SDR family oxidoreductase [Betaproteobacteria bacterium]|nr:SDR family oxidoreductase [Betaproteobacteria bacterium]